MWLTVCGCMRGIRSRVRTGLSAVHAAHGQRLGAERICRASDAQPLASRPCALWALDLGCDRLSTQFASCQAFHPTHPCY